MPDLLELQDAPEGDGAVENLITGCRRETSESDSDGTPLSGGSVALGPQHDLSVEVVGLPSDAEAVEDDLLAEVRCQGRSHVAIVHEEAPTRFGNLHCFDGDEVDLIVEPTIGLVNQMQGAFRGWNQDGILNNGDGVRVFLDCRRMPRSDNIPDFRREKRCPGRTPSQTLLSRLRLSSPAAESGPDAQAQNLDTASAQFGVFHVRSCIDRVQDLMQGLILLPDRHETTLNLENDMRALMVMFDSLNRHMLPPYGCDWIHAPNFQRLAERTVSFDKSYICSMPCMPARRDLHTGRPGFLHRDWGPLEPFDDSVPRILRTHGISSHLISDHYHYWESGGATYHTQYETWQFHRGQEGDPWIGQAAEMPPLSSHGQNGWEASFPRQDRVNRQLITAEWQQPQAKTFNAGLDFLRRNGSDDNWFLQIETFDPHEPFFTQRRYQDLYPDLIDRDAIGPRLAGLFDWPEYGPVKESRELIEQCRGHYAALLSMCDARLGEVLDEMDRQQMWEDTMLVVWTDHGFLLGEHDLWAKLEMPWYQEQANTPFFVWDPRCGKSGERRSSLVQPSIDLGPTLLELFGLELTPDMLGRPLAATIADDKPVREAAIFGNHGDQVNVTDGRYVYMRSPVEADNSPLFNYTLMPYHVSSPYSVAELTQAELVDSFSFTKGCQLLRMPAETAHAQNSYGNLLFDLEQDPGQRSSLTDPQQEQRMADLMRALMRDCDAPAEQYRRLGLQ